MLYANDLVIKFKNPDFTFDLTDAGVTEKAAKRLQKLAGFGEYWELRLTMNEDGSIAEAKFIKSSMR